MFKFSYKEVKINCKQDGKIIKDRAIVIYLEDTEKKEYYPHPITHFFSKYYYIKGRKINTELSAVKMIIPFLNYIFREVENNNINFKGVNGISDITNKHVSLYLQDCVNIKGELNSTSKTKEAYLSKFYKYLSNEGILKEKPKFNVFVRKSRDGEVYTTYNLDLIYKVTNEEKLKRKIKRKDILSQHDGNNDGNNRLRLIRIYEFLTLAEQVAPDIAFGLALEIFAGLRRGEVVNLLRKSLKPQNGCKYGENGLIIKVRSNREVLFNRLNNTKDDGVKKPRDQASLIDPILCYLYKKHLENVLPKYKKITNNKALFYDGNGNPMSAEVFDSRFKKVKERYIGQLLVTSGRKSDYDDFNETRWGSHIGRGIFTNMCRDVGYNVEQTSILRGDSTTEAMQSYFDIISATHNIERALELLSPIEYDGQIRNNREFEELRREVLKKL